MTDQDITQKLQTMDARQWAEAFMALWGEQPGKIDLDLMTAWFANAIMRGYDCAKQQDQPLVDALHRLAKLGAGERYGNSVGNVMAQKVLRQTGHID